MVKICLIHINQNHLILLLVSICFKNIFNHNVSIIDDMGTIYHVAILGSTNKTANVTYLEIGFPSVNRGQGSSSTDSRLSSPSLRQARRQALERQGRSTDVDYYAWALRFPALWGVNEPTNDSIGPGSSDQTEAPRNSNNHTGEKYINVRAGRSLTPP